MRRFTRGYSGDNRYLGSTGMLIPDTTNVYVSKRGDRVLSSGKISHCGIMVNYRCTAACRHCLYACSPKRADGYISAEKTREICEILIKTGCRSVHIGGGEPFIDFNGLLDAVREFAKARIRIEYIETNAFWAKDESFVEERLKRLLEAGGNALCISIDPFHAEYIPPERPLLLAKICDRTGMGFFLWKRHYIDSLSKAGLSTAHSREELEAAISPAYIRDAAADYGIHYGGRALMIEEEYSPRYPVESFSAIMPCRSLLSLIHGHIDLNGFYIPPSCTGIKIPIYELINGIPDGKYPVFETLYKSGASGLLQYAVIRGFHPDSGGYTSMCAMCIHIRKWLSQNGEYAELDREHYEAAEDYYSKREEIKI